jgi:hypothetical protein
MFHRAGSMVNAYRGCLLVLVVVLGLGELRQRKGRADDDQQKRHAEQCRVLIQSLMDRSPAHLGRKGRHGRRGRWWKQPSRGWTRVSCTASRPYHCDRYVVFKFLSLEICNSNDTILAAAPQFLRALTSTDVHRLGHPPSRTIQTCRRGRVLALARPSLASVP